MTGINEESGGPWRVVWNLICSICNKLSIERFDSRDLSFSIDNSSAYDGRAIQIFRKKKTKCRR